MIELVKLILAHLIGDFFLQTSYGIRQKNLKKWRSSYLYWHALIHFFLIILLFWDIRVWPEALFISMAHLIIDGAKLTFVKTNNSRKWFFGDQFAHLLVIGIVWVTFFDNDIQFMSNTYFWAAAAGFVFIINPAGYIVQIILSRWEDEIEKDREQSLFMAGKTIGILERILIYISILAGYAAAIGFMIAAKSIFRFGDLTRAKDRKLTEFILIGTLISFLLAVAAGVIVVALPI